MRNLHKVNWGPRYNKTASDWKTSMNTKGSKNGMWQKTKREGNITQ